MLCTTGAMLSLFQLWPTVPYNGGIIRLLVHVYSNPLTAFSANMRPIALPLATQATMTKVAILTCSALLMISHPASIFLICTFYVNRSAPVAPPLDAL